MKHFKPKRSRSASWGLCLAALTIICFSVATLLVQPLQAQEIAGGITGTVTDPSGALVPGAQVTATDLPRGTVWPTETDSAGIYNFPRVPASQYVIKVVAKGFQTAVEPAFDLQMNQIARVDVQLLVGTTTQTVEVTAANTLLHTDSIQVGTVTSANFNDNLPLASRDYTQMALMTPGVTTTVITSLEGYGRNQGGGSIMVNGNRPQANSYLLNGQDNEDFTNNEQIYIPSVDAIQEFDVITSNYSAQYQQAQGGVTSVMLKSGTNKYHGDAFEFLRNDILNANTWANDWQNVKKSALRGNIFGATFGGPIKKDKLFFFIDYQGTRDDTPPSYSLASYMDASEEQGNFSQLLTPPTGTAKQLYNPCASFSGACTEPANPEAVRQAFSGNIIPTSMLDPVPLKLFASGKYPTPINNNLQYNTLTLSHSYLNNDQGDVKIDYMLNNSNHIWGSFTDGYQNTPTVTSVVLTGNSYNYSPLHVAVIDWTHTFSPTFVMDAKVGVNRFFYATGSSNGGLGNFANSLGIGDGNVHGPGLLSLGLSNGYASGVGNSGIIQEFASTQFEPQVDFFLTRGHHEIHLGFQAMRIDMNVFYAGNDGKWGSLDFNGQYTAGPNPTNLSAPGSNEGVGEADFMLGLPEEVALGPAEGTWGQRGWDLGIYAQDDWRVTKRLTLNLGLRWQFNEPWYEVLNREANYSPISGTLELPGQNGNSRALYNSYYKDWEPRLGFAWSPSFLGNKTVVRGAYTISSFMESTGTNLRLPLNPPFEAEYELDYNTGTNLYYPPSTLDQGLTPDVTPANPAVGANIRLWDPNVMPALVQQWNFSVEHQLPGQMLFSLGYVGQHGTHLMVPMPYLQKRLPGEAGCPSTSATVCPSQYLSGNPTLYSEIGQISGTASTGNQDYHALQASLSKHLTKGLEYQISYTYSKAMDNALGFFGIGGEVSSNSAYWQNLYDSYAEWGPAAFSDTQNLSAGYVYQLPFGRGKQFGGQMNRGLNALLGNWQTSGMLTFHTGFPSTITASDVSGTSSRGYRANCIAPVSYTRGVGPKTSWFNISSFSEPASGTFGSCSVGSVIGPGAKEWDAGIQKIIPVTESKHFEFRTEFINATNHPTFNGPNTSVTSSTFGEITGTQNPRFIQFALKFYY